MSARRLPTLAAACALLAACSTSGAQLSAKPTISVSGKPVPSTGVGTVAEALREAGVPIPTGRILSVKTHRPVGFDRSPGRVLLDGLPTLPAAPVSAGAVITVEKGVDEIESLQVVTMPVAANDGIATVRVGARPGTQRVVRGIVSHEVVSVKALTKPFDGHLPFPRAVSLTFDDGPSPQWTPIILSELANAHVHATFCLIGRQAAEYPNLVKAIVAGGHTLCNHTWDHDEGINHRSPAVMRSEMTKAQAAITKASGGIVPKLFRAPGGAWSVQVERTARSLGMTPLKWTVDPRDWSRPGEGHIISVVFGHTHPGGIVLLHDGGGRRDQTAAALTVILGHLPAHGFRFFGANPS